MSGCYYCGTDKDLRPYGPGGADVCFPCGTATPEREDDAKRAYLTLLDAAETFGPVMIGTEQGPVNVDVEAIEREAGK